MATFNNGESAASVRTKINAAIEKVDGTASSWDISADSLDLKAIAETKAVTAVDVFVYDTSKDSDGGAWRHRTQNTSWYNETLNTSTRGSRREFPAVAVIVAEGDGIANYRVTIYDGDDPALPLWMAFVGNSVYDLLFPGGSKLWSAVAAYNGTIAITSNTNVVGGTQIASFLEDAGWRISNFSSATFPTYTGKYQGNIGSRNANAGWAVNSSGKYSALLVDNEANDVAMTVLPDAPIDPATGLPVPTIAVATDGGVSVIKDDGTVVDSAYTAVADGVSFANEGIWYSDNSGKSALFYASTADYRSGDGFGDELSDVLGSKDFALLAKAQSLAVFPDTVVAGATNFGSLAVPGLMFHQPNYTDQTKGMSALLTSTYNTGWMNGDIKGAFLSDTDDTDLVGSGELVTNGTFDTDTTGWTDASSAGGSIAWNAAGYVDLINSTGTVRLQQDIPVTAGKVYAITVEVVSLGGSTSAALFLDNAGSSTISFSTLGVGTHTAYYVAPDTTLNISIRNFSTGTTVSIDNISVKLADPSRSV